MLEHGASAFLRRIRHHQRKTLLDLVSAQPGSSPPPSGRLAASTLGEPSGPPAWKTIPSWDVIGTADKVLPPGEQLFMAGHAGARITGVDAGIYP